MRARILTGAIAAAITLAGFAVSKYEGSRYIAYQDIGGTYTICEGHTRNVKAGDTATPEQCQSFKEDDLRIANAAIDRCVKVPLTVGERAAFLDFTFNVGESAFCGSSLVRKLNAGDHAGACDELTRWVYAGGKKLQGLVERREYEHALCVAPDKSA